MKYSLLSIIIFTFMLFFFSCKNDSTDTPEYGGPDNPTDETCEIIDNIFSDLESSLANKFEKDYSDKKAVLSAVKEKLSSVGFIKNVETKNDTCIVITFANGLQSNIIYDTFDYDYDINEDALKPDDFLQNIPELMGETHDTGILVDTKEMTETRSQEKPLFEYLYIRHWEPFNAEGVTDTAVVQNLQRQNKIYPMKWTGTNDNACTLESLCNIGNADSEGFYPSVIIIATHGRGGKILQTVYNQNDFNTLYSWWMKEKEKEKEEKEEKEDREIIDLIIHKTDTKKRINIPLDYLSENLNSLKNSIVFLNHCESTPIEQLGLCMVFIKKGASVVFGYRFVVSGNDCIQNTYTILSYMLQPPSRGNDVPHSAFFAYQKMPTIIKNNLWFTGSVTNKVRFSPKVYTRRPNTRSVVGMGALHLDYCDPTAGYDKVVCGLVYATDEENLYLDSEEKAGFVSTEVDHFVENGEDFFFSMENLKPKTTY